MSYVLESMRLMRVENKALIKLCFIVGASILSLVVLPLKFVMSIQIIGLLQLLGWYNPPRWVVWAIWAAGAVSVVLAILASAGWVTVPLWIARALLAADSISV